MDVIVPQTVGVQQEMDAGDNALQDPEEPLLIRLIDNEVLPRIASGGHVDPE